MMPVLAEGYYTGGFLVSEARGDRSRDAGIIENAGATVVALADGLVVSQNSAGTATITATPGNVGNGAASAVTVLPGAVFGEYSIIATSATSFDVTDPNGNALPPLTVGTAYADEIGLTITAGSTPFAVGDDFTVNVESTVGSWTSWTGGAFTKLGILFNRVEVNPGSFRNVSIVTRQAEVNQAEVQFDPAITSAGDAATLIANAFTALAAENIIIAR
ncbi:MAG: hypothetical protein HIU90_07370 [Proteobacteria bacterium]|nr:hypothetical protein [Pseudomonadota bacterium]